MQYILHLTIFSAIYTASDYCSIINNKEKGYENK